MTFKNRAGFTLVELLVAMAIIVLLASLVIAFMPSINDQQRAAKGGTDLQGILSIAKQRAFQRGSIYGVRLLNKNGDGLITDFQYLEKPDDFTGTWVNNQNLTPVKLSITNNAAQLDFHDVDFLNGSGTDPTLWTVQPNDYIEVLGGGTPHRINWAANFTTATGGIGTSLFLASAPCAFAPIFKVEVTGTPLTGLEAFTLEIKVDLPSGLVTMDTAAIPFNSASNGVENTVNDAIQALFPMLADSMLPKASVSGQAGGPWHVTFSMTKIHPLFGANFASEWSFDLSPKFVIPPAVAPAAYDVLVTPPPTPVMQQAFCYRIMRAPRISGDEQLQLPKDIVVDLTRNVDFAKYGTFMNGPLPFNNGDLDILFAPSGAMITPGFNQDFLALWVRDVNGGTEFEGGPTLIAIHTRTGLIAAHPPNDSSPDPYSFVRDGRAR